MIYWADYILISVNGGTEDAEQSPDAACKNPLRLDQHEG
jgi:hypothetical protein